MVHFWLSKTRLEHESRAGCFLQAGTVRRGDQTFRCDGATCDCGLCHRKCCSRLLLPHGGPLQHPGVLLSETPSLVKAVHHILMGLGCNVRLERLASKMCEARLPAPLPLSTQLSACLLLTMRAQYSLSVPAEHIHISTQSSRVLLCNKMKRTQIRECTEGAIQGSVGLGPSADALLLSVSLTLYSFVTGDRVWEYHWMGRPTGIWWARSSMTASW